MYDTPVSLQEICLDYISEHYWDVFTQPEAWCRGFYEIEDSTCNDFKFKDPDIFLFAELSEKLLTRLNEKGCLNDGTLRLFNGRNTRLRNVKIIEADVTYTGLIALREHKINELQCVNLGELSVSKIIDCLNEDSKNNLTHLNVTDCSFFDWSGQCSMVQLTTLKNLRTLNVAHTEFNQQALEMVCEYLKFLERLDISHTCVTSLTPLLPFKDRLISLTAIDLHGINTLTETIIEIDSLRHLDISLVKNKYEAVQNQAISDILENPDKLPNLVSLDISGWRDLIPKATLEIFIEAHPKLEYLGLVLNPVAFEVFLSEPCDGCRLAVAGLGNVDQIMNSLKKYCDRYVYVQKALYHLFQLAATFTMSRSDILELVLPAMDAHPKKFGVQMAATACLYNLTRGDLSKQIHPGLLSRAVTLTLLAMENYSQEYQLIKNGLLTLCSDRILQDISFNRFHCARIVLDALCTFNEINMNRMSVAICSILAAKISTQETSELGSSTWYMCKLLSMVEDRVASKHSDITMKFTLSALWNLTDESEVTCTNFLEHDGAELFIKVLKVFRNDSAVETKVLGLLNNIAEVEELRKKLMLDSLMEELFFLLKYQHIDVSYFAAGIVAHLASDGDSKWTLREFGREKMLMELEKAVTGWGIPDGEMVAYRSFRPFFPLLKGEVDYRVQLWAVWAVHHVCTKNPKRYCRMLRFENGADYLVNLINNPNCNSIVFNICTEILKTLRLNMVY